MCKSKFNQPARQKQACVGAKTQVQPPSVGIWGIHLTKWFLVNASARRIMPNVSIGALPVPADSIHATSIRHPQGRVSRRLSAKEMRHCHVHDGLALRRGGRV